MDHAVLGRYLRPFFVLALIVLGACAGAQTAFQGPFQELGHSWPGMEILDVRPSVPPTAPIEEIDWTFPNQKVSNPSAKWHPYAPTKGAFIQIWATEYFPRSGSFKLSDMLSEDYSHYEGGKTQVRPTAVVMKRTLYGSTITGSMYVNFYQTHIFVENKLVPLSSPRNVTGTSIPFSTTGGQDTTVVAVAVPQFYIQTYGDSNVANRTGKFRMEIAPSNGIDGATYWCDFVIKGGGIAGFNPEDPGLGPGNPKGGGGPAEGANGTEEEQKGFWGNLFEDLFVPSEESVEDLANSWQRFRYWGPYGFASSMHDRMNAAVPDTSPLGGWSSPYKIYAGTTPASLGSVPIEFDLEPYKDYIRFTRMIILAGLIWVFGTNLHRWLARGKQD